MRPCTIRAGIDTFRIPDVFDLYVFVLSLNSLIRELFTYVVSAARQSIAKGAACVSNSAQNYSRMCMCIEFIIHVPKQENAQEFFPVGIVVSVDQACSGPTRIGLLWEMLR